MDIVFNGHALSGKFCDRARVLKGRHYVAVMSDAEEVRSIRPNFPELLKLDRPTIAVTARDIETRDYVLRFFAPANGVPEDPVSGVAQCSLVPFWAGEYKRNKLKSQLSARGGIMDCEAKGDLVVISGPCAPIAHGKLDFAEER